MFCVEAVFGNQVSLPPRTLALQASTASSSGGTDPWQGWHPGLLGRDSGRAGQGQHSNAECRRRADLSSRGLQPGTSGYQCGDSSQVNRPSRGPPDIRTLMPEALDHLEDGAWQYGTAQAVAGNGGLSCYCRRS